MSRFKGGKWITWIWVGQRATKWRVSWIDPTQIFNRLYICWLELTHHMDVARCTPHFLIFLILSFTLMNFYGRTSSLRVFFCSSVGFLRKMFFCKLLQKKFFHKKNSYGRTSFVRVFILFFTRKTSFVGFLWKRFFHKKKTLME